ncbi:hypothetical protein EC973_007379 [Apophysomyces ossiformis]|uniref:Centromere protein N n=1 Tax=Apophysomyces ossiformis TaxID=679940 RepID=A0A8H7ER18_9FUNG|nr:hypothetical protein EC973_007379 [Apophysomyces ossiformis]
MLTEADRYPIDYSERVKSYIRRLSREQLLDVIKQWFAIPELRPSLSSWDDYLELKKAHKYHMLERFMNQDWPESLCALQIAHIDMTYLLSKASLKKWKVWKLRKNHGHLAVWIDHKTAQDRIQKHLSQYYRCHCYSVVHEKTETHWYRIMLFDDLQTRDLPLASNHVYLIHYPNTEFLLCGGSLRKEMKSYIIQAILGTFDADDVQEEDLTSKRMDRLQEIILNRKSLGVFDQFRKNQFDGNPLDIRQKVNQPASEGYVKTREERRRIVPLHQDQLRERTEETERRFGKNVAQGVELLQFNLSLSMEHIVEAHMGEGASIPGDNEELSVTMKMRGSNVMEGLRQLALRGILKPPFPDWLTDVVATGTQHVLIRKDGVFKETMEEDEEETQ